MALDQASQQFFFSTRTKAEIERFKVFEPETGTDQRYDPEFIQQILHSVPGMQLGKRIAADYEENLLIR